MQHHRTFDSIKGNLPLPLLSILASGWRDCVVAAIHVLRKPYDEIPEVLSTSLGQLQVFPMTNTNGLVSTSGPIET